jgi:hypothetical protein
MDEIKKIIDELGIDALESNTKIAGVAVVSDSGNIVYQTDNWDLTNQTNVILNVMKGDRSFVLNDGEFSVVKTTTEGYAMPQADPPRALAFLKTYATRLNGKV